MLRLRVINNGDHAGLVWFPDDGQPIAACRGFGVQCRRTRGAQNATLWLNNTVGFAAGQAKPAVGSEWQWPIQRYLWWDYSVQVGDVVQYRIVPVTGADQHNLAPDEAAATAWSTAETISGQDGPTIEAYFNRGIIASQWVARELADEAAKQEGKGARALLITAIADTANPLRKQLGGLLLSKLTALLAAAKAAGGKIYAALYELNDPDVLAGLTAFGADCNLILANGAFKPPGNDENAEVRKALRKAGKINLFDRLVTGAHFAHNKFIVFCDAGGKAQQVWTGSTNTTMTGLCTQANNGILIKDATVADAFLQEWGRLHQAGNSYPPSLAAANSQQQTFTVPAAAGTTNQVTVWFAPTDHGQDMDHARGLINQAKDGILFLNFNPGKFQDEPEQWTLLQTILNRHAPGQNPYYDAGLYIRGVVNQEIPGLTEAAAPAAAGARAAPAPSAADLDPAAPVNPVVLFDGGTQAPLRLDRDVLVPENVRQTYGEWETELKGASSVMIHSKVVILDPFGAHPVVMTGSHNQGMKASRSNDDNLVIIEGNAALAQAYALNTIAIFQEYRWRHYTTTHAAAPAAPAAPPRWTGLQDNDTWQTGHLTKDKPELDFWLE